MVDTLFYSRFALAFTIHSSLFNALVAEHLTYNFGQAADAYLNVSTIIDLARAKWSGNVALPFFRLPTLTLIASVSRTTSTNAGIA